ncbi:MAG: hypothetical protein M0P71_07135 [Melioribacteraceae bacterium]|nr:hypothetical protein [Melioribacteraceae bacterium]
MKESIKIWISSLILLPIALYYIFNGGAFTFIDYINLLIHEGGHGIFSIFPRFLYMLGGSLTQLFIPLMFVVFYFVKKQKVLFQLSTIWFAESMMNVSVYVSDARAMALPLLGGNKVIHDWHYLLGELNLLEYDTIFGNALFISAAIIMAIALLAPLYIKEKRYSKIELIL